MFEFSECGYPPGLGGEPSGLGFPDGGLDVPAEVFQLPQEKKTLLAYKMFRKALDFIAERAHVAVPGIMEEPSKLTPLYIVNLLTFQHSDLQGLDTFFAETLPSEATADKLIRTFDNLADEALYDPSRFPSNRQIKPEKIRFLRLLLFSEAAAERLKEKVREEYHGLDPDMDITDLVEFREKK